MPWPGLPATPPSPLVDRGEWTALDASKWCARAQAGVVTATLATPPGLFEARTGNLTPAHYPVPTPNPGDGESKPGLTRHRSPLFSARRLAIFILHFQSCLNMVNPNGQTLVAGADQCRSHGRPARLPAMVRVSGGSVPLRSRALGVTEPRKQVCRLPRRTLGQANLRQGGDLAVAGKLSHWTILTLVRAGQLREAGGVIGSEVCSRGAGRGRANTMHCYS